MPFWSKGKVCKKKAEPEYVDPRKGTYLRGCEIYDTYIEITPDMPSQDVIAIQDWLIDHPNTIFECMPYASLMMDAKRDGKALVYINKIGVINTNAPVNRNARKLTPIIYPKMVNYQVAPSTIEIAGKRYDRKEALEILAQLETK